MPNEDVTDLLEAALTAGVSRHAYQKGLYLAEAGNVNDCSIAVETDGEVVVMAKVLGSEPNPYHVTARVKPAEHGRLELTGQCSCPVGKSCKHIAAAVHHACNADDGLDDEEYEVKPRKPVRPSTQLPSARVSPPPEMLQPTLSPGTATWLARLQSARQPEPERDPNSYAPGTTRRMIYVIKPTSAGFSTEVFTAATGKTGGYTQVRRFHDLDELCHGVSSQVLPIDRQIGKLLKVAHSDWGPAQKLSPEDAAELLPLLLQTGRCHLKSYAKKNPPLELGEPRPGKMVWRIDAKGHQYTGLEVEPRAMDWLQLSPPWYIDAEQGACGPIETGFSPALVRAWLDAPALPPGEAALVAEHTTWPTEGPVLPKPARIPVQTLTGVKVRPLLHLFAVQAHSYYTSYYKKGDGTPKAHLAELCMDYGGYILPVTGNPRTVHEEFQDGELKRFWRDPKAENIAIERLIGHGFTNASNLYYGLENRVSHCLTFHNEEQWAVFMDELDSLRKEGWQVQIDPGFEYALAEPESWYADAKELDGNDWFGVELGIMLDGKKVNLLPILLQYFRRHPGQLTSEALAGMNDKSAIKVPLPDGRVLSFPAKRLRRMLGVLLELLEGESLNKAGQLKMRAIRAAELSEAADNAEWRWMGGTELQAMHKRLRNFNGVTRVPAPASLQASLRGYQQQGVSWLQFLREYQLAGILADDMGLGKTVQALAHLLIEKESGRADRPSLVVAPTSLMTNWRQETERFAPSLRVLVLHGQDRKQHFDKVNDHDLIVTSYPLLPRDQQFLLEQKFHCVILDEAQFIKNPKTLYAQIACQLNGRHLLCLTGTPMENHLGELWSLFNFLLPGFLGDETRFNGIFRRPIERGRSDDRRKVLARRVAPFILRRRKDEVVKELPPKTEIVQNVELAGAQRDLYESLRLAMHQKIKDEVNKKGINRSHIIILDALLKLRQVCCDPRLVSVPSAQKINESAKLELLMDLLPGMLEEGRRILLFSQFTSMLALIEKELQRMAIPYVLLTGQTQDRATPIQRFQSRAVPLFLISLKAGGTGLNLTAADTVIHYDPWWNPAVENQATDRAHRIGQDKPVFVYKLMTVGTVEEKISAMQARKRELVEGLLDEGRRDNLKLTSEDLDVLFSPIS